MRSSAHLAVALTMAIAMHAGSSLGQARTPTPLGSPAVFVSLLAGPDSSAVSSGVISPDGTLFLFGVERKQEHALYLLDLHTRQTRRISVSAGGFMQIAWSPDGKRIAYWLGRRPHGARERPAALWVAARDGSQVRQIDSLPSDDGSYWPMPINWLDDDRIVTGYHPLTLEVGAEPVTSFARRPTGEPVAAPVGQPRWITGSGLSRSGRLAYLGTCCGGSHPAVRMISADSDVCIAGPAPWTDQELRWDERRQRLYLVSVDWRDSGRTTLFAIDRGARGARRIQLPGFRIWESSMSRDGSLWFTDEGAKAPTRALWVLPADTLDKYLSSSEPLLT